MTKHTTSGIKRWGCLPPASSGATRKTTSGPWGRRDRAGRAPKSSSTRGRGPGAGAPRVPWVAIATGSSRSGTWCSCNSTRTGAERGPPSRSRASTRGWGWSGWRARARGGGYALGRIMRRALRHGKKLGLDRPFLHRVAAAVVREFSSAYPDLGRSASYIDTVSLNEEKRFLETLDAGLRMVEEEFARIGKAGVKVFAGSVAFKLYDTFGFPVDLTADLCRERGVALDTGTGRGSCRRRRARRSTS